MPSPQNKELQRLLAPSLKACGFKKTGATWHRPDEDTICVVNLQGSQWSSEIFYINLGVYFKALGKENRPSENRCHIRVRLDNLVPDARSLDRMLNLNEPVPVDKRRAELTALLSEYALPWLERFSSINSAKAQLPGAQSGKTAVVTLAARKFLESA